MGSGETPINGRPHGIAFGFEGKYALSKSLNIGHSTSKTTALENANLNLGHIQPTTVRRCVVYLKACDQAVRLCGWEDQIQVRQTMDIEVILHQANILGVRIAHIG